MTRRSVFGVLLAPFLAPLAGFLPKIQPLTWFRVPPKLEIWDIGDSEHVKLHKKLWAQNLKWYCPDGTSFNSEVVKKARWLHKVMKEQREAELGIFRGH